MIALVTGASGFIGSTLIEELNRQGIEVRALMRTTSNDKHLRGLKYDRFEGHLGDMESIRRAAQGVDYVFHLAGVVAAKNRAAYFESNAEGTANIARAISDLAKFPKRVVYVSSIAAGGPMSEKLARKESDQDQPVSWYGQSKLAGEKEFLKFKDRFPTAIVRPPIVYGPRDKDVFVMIQSVAKNLMPLLPGTDAAGNKYYSLIHVRDLVRGLIQVAQAPIATVPSGEIFYLAEDRYYTYVEMMGTMATHLGRKPIRLKVPKFALVSLAHGMGWLGALTGRVYPLNKDKLNEILPSYWICSNEKARKLLGFRPELDLHAGMLDAIQWYKKEKWI